MNTVEQKQPQSPEAPIQKKQPSFDDFNLLPEVKQAVSKLNFKTPTAIQSGTYRRIMAGEDVIAMAQTGTGKTAAFGIPMAQKLDPKKNEVQALVLTPTRELALQVCKEIGAIGGVRGIKSAAVYGGASFTKQVQEVKDGAKVVAGTPGRVLDHIRRKTISFSNVEILVLDEADEMLSMGFEKEISQIIESLPKKRQTLLFSATIPDDIRRLTMRYMGEAEVVSVSGDGIAASEISHYVYLVSGQGRPKDMLRVIEAERPESAIIFCNTKDETQVVAKHLQAAGYNAEWLNSDLSQNEREEVMRRTRSNKIRFLVATDVAARGIDVSHLSHVINYTFPESLEVYVHRTGRTGRMGRHGTAVSLIAPQDIGNLYYMRLTYNIHPVEKTLANEAESAKLLELDRMKALSAAFGGEVNGDFLGLARRVVRHVRGERIVAGLLANHFNSQPRIDVTSEAAPVPIMPPVPSTAASKTEETVKSGEPVEKPAVEKAKPDERSQKKQAKKHDTKTADKGKKTPDPGKVETKPKDSKKTGSEMAELFIDAGRKDGLRIAYLMEKIVELTGLPRSALGKVRMLTRSAFIAVPSEHMDKIAKAIGKVEIDNRKLKAEPATQS